MTGTADACDLPPPDGRRDGRVVALLGACLGLTTPALLHGLLLPELDQAPGHGQALAGAAVVVALVAGPLGALCAARKRVLQGVSLLTALVGCLAARALPLGHDALVEVVNAHLGLPGSILLGSAGAVFGLALLAPSAALAAAGLDGTPRGLARLALGLAAGLAAAPWLGEVVLGRVGLLQAASVVAGAAGVALADGAPFTPVTRRLAVTRAPSLIALGLIGGLLTCLLQGRVDLGLAAGAWLAGAVCVGTAVGLMLRQPSPWAPLALVGLPWLVGWEPVVRPLGLVDPLSEGLLLAALGVALGLGLGGHLRPADAGLPRAWAVPMVFVPLALGQLLLPALPQPAVAGALFVVVWVGAQRTPLTRAGWPLAVAVGLALVPLPPPPGALPVEEFQRRPDATVALVTDPLSGHRRLAVDGRAPVGRSGAQLRRLVHVPALLQAGSLPAAPLDRTLIVAHDRGEAAAAGAEHSAARLDWLLPVPHPWAAPPAHAPEQFLLAHGNERLFLRSEEGSFDLIVLLPDPRARTRAGLLATRETYALLSQRLSEGGLFCQWWDLATVDVTDLKAAIGSALSAVPHVSLLLDHPRARQGMVGLVGGQRPLSLDLARLEARLEERPAVAADLARVGLEARMLPALLAQNTGVLQLLAPTERGVSDQRTVLGLRTVLRPLHQPETPQSTFIAFFDRRCDPIAWLHVPPGRGKELGLLTRDLLDGTQHLIGGAQAVLAASAGAPAPFEAQGDTFPVHPREADELIEALAALPDWAWLRGLVIGHAAALERDGRADEAEVVLRRAVALAPRSASLRFALAATVEGRGDVDDACTLYGTVLAFEPEHAEARAAVSRLCPEGSR